MGQQGFSPTGPEGSSQPLALGNEARIRSLVRRLAETEAELAALAGGVDSVFDQSAVTPILLREAQGELAASEARYDRLVRAMSAIVFELTPDGDVVFANDAVTAILGYAPAELQGQRWVNAVVPLDQRDLLAGFYQRMQAGDVSGYEVTTTAKDGSRVFLELSTANHYLPDGSLERIVGIATDITERKKAEAAVKQQGEQLQALTRRLISVQEEERRKLARELHDEAGQYLAALSVGIGALAKKADCPPTMATRLREYNSLVSNLAQEMHEIVVALRPASLDRNGLDAAVAQYVSSIVERYGLDVKLAARGMEARLPSEIETAIYRLVQEALTNVVLHARASQARVHIERDPDAIAAVIEDDGIGFDLEEAARSGRLGLVGMRERTQMIGGEIKIDTGPGRGTRVAVRVPLGG